MSVLRLPRWTVKALNYGILIENQPDIVAKFQEWYDPIILPDTVSPEDWFREREDE